MSSWFLPLGVTGNTPDSGSGESWFDPRRGNLHGAARRKPAAFFVAPPASRGARTYGTPSSRCRSLQQSRLTCGFRAATARRVPQVSGYMQPSSQQHPRCRVMSCGAVPWRGPESAAYRVGLSKGRPYGIRHHRVGARAASGLGPAARIGAPHHAHASARGFTRRQRAPQRPTALDRAPLRHGSPPDTSSSPLDTSSRLVLALLDYRRARQSSPTFLATPAERCEEAGWPRAKQRTLHTDL